MVLESVFIKIAFLIAFVSASVFPNFPSNYEFNFITQEDKIAKPVDGNDWWKTASFYQIYPRSFKDSDGDGIGDLKGIREKLPYLKEIGITATWLSPIFTSPMADFGYDVANFTEIDSIFGTMDDFDSLIRESKEIGVKVILDFVPNHSSDECEWFQKSIARDPEFEDFYIWHPGKIVNGVRQPPTNWVSVFRGSAWKWNEQRQEYYLHQFVDKQPDLNYRNPKVKQYMNEVLRFWLKKGVSGFRVDAVPHVFEISPDANGNYLDEPRNDWVSDPDDYGYLDHIYTTNQPETVQLVYEWRKVLDDFRAENGGEERILMIESWSSVDIVMQYYGNGSTEGAQIPFNFLIISSLTNESTAYDYADVINTWMEKMPKGRTANWVNVSTSDSCPPEDESGCSTSLNSFNHKEQDEETREPKRKKRKICHLEENAIQCMNLAKDLAKNSKGASASIDTPAIRLGKMVADELGEVEEDIFFEAKWKIIEV